MAHPSLPSLGSPLLQLVIVPSTAVACVKKHFLAISFQVSLALAAPCDDPALFSPQAD